MSGLPRRGTCLPPGAAGGAILREKWLACEVILRAENPLPVRRRLSPAPPQPCSQILFSVESSCSKILAWAAIASSEADSGYEFSGVA
jgi:hypothetical protein